MQLLVGVIALLVAGTGHAVITNPTPQRSYVSLGGSDSANCGPTTPCRTWQAALAQTQPGGEILTLDSGGFGLLTITQAVTLVVPPGVYGGMSPPPGSSGIVINAPGDTVVIRGVTIMSQGGTSGIDIQAASHVVLQDVTVAGFNDNPSTENGIVVEGTADVRVEHCHLTGNVRGIYVPASGVTLDVIDSVLADSTIQDIYLGNPTASTTSSLTIANSELTGAPVALLVEPGVGAAAVASVDGSRFRGNGSAVVAAVAGAASTATVDMVGSRIAYNNVGVQAFGGGATVSLQQCSLNGNATAASIVNSQSTGTGVVLSFGNNAFLSNTSDVSGGSLTASPAFK